MALVVQAVRRLTLTAYSLPSASAEEVGFCPHPKPHLVWYLFALCQRTVEVKERCRSVPFGYQRPAVEMNNMRIAHMRQAHNMMVWLKKWGMLCMRMKQKEKKIYAGFAKDTKKPAHGGLSMQKVGYP